MKEAQNKKDLDYTNNLRVVELHADRMSGEDIAEKIMIYMSTHGLTEEDIIDIKYSTTATEVVRNGDTDLLLASHALILYSNKNILMKEAVRVTEQADDNED